MGWNGSRGEPVKRKAEKAPGRWRGAVAALLVVLAAMGAVWFFVLRDSEVVDRLKKERKSKMIAVAEADLSSTPAVAEQEEPVEKTKDDIVKEKIAKFRSMTPSERLTYLIEEAKNRPYDPTPPTNRVFASGVEQVMSWIFTTNLGDMPPPLPQLSLFDEVHLAEIIIADNPVSEDDSDRVKDAKEMVGLAKDELAKFILEGGDVEDFLSYYRGKLMDAFNERQECQKQALLLLKEEPEIAGAFLEEINSRLEEKGIQPIEIPAPVLEKFGVEL